MQYCPVAAGLCRGCPLSLTLYITYMDRFSRDSKGSIEFPVWWPLYYFFALCGGWKLAGFSKCWSAHAGSAKWLTAELALPKMRPWVSAWKGWSSFSRLVRSSPSRWSSNILKSYSWVRGGWSSTCNDIDALPAFVWWRELNMLLLQIKKGPITVILVIWFDFLLDISQVMCMSIPGEDPEAISGHAGKIMSLDWLGNASVSLQKS